MREQQEFGEKRTRGPVRVAAGIVEGRRIDQRGGETVAGGSRRRGGFPKERRLLRGRGARVEPATVRAVARGKRKDSLSGVENMMAFRVFVNIVACIVCVIIVHTEIGRVRSDSGLIGRACIDVDNMAANMADRGGEREKGTRTCDFARACKNVPTSHA